MLTAPVADARAVGNAVTRSPEDRALSMDRSVSSLVFTPETGDTEHLRWRFEAGEWRLFEVDGLAAMSCAAELRWGSWGGAVAASVLSSPVGKEIALGGTLLAADVGRVSLAGGWRFETVALDGCERESLLTFSVDAVVRISAGLVMGSSVGGVHLAGIARPGADAALRIVVFPAGALTGVAGIVVSRSGDVACDVSSRFRVARRIHAVLGYDDGSAAIHGSLSIAVRSLALDAGASVHPVLGVSKSLFVSWRWGSWDR